MAEPALGPQSKITVGLLLSLAALVGGGLWWAGSWTGSIQVKLDTIIAELKTTSGDGLAMRARIELIERDIEVWRTVGTPALRPKVDEIEKRLDKLELNLPTKP